MNNLFALVKKELTSYFYSPIAYVVITIFLIISGIFFYFMLIGYANESQMIMSRQYDPYLAQYLAQYPLTYAARIFQPLSGDMSLIMLFIIPLLTMKLLAEEKKSGTFELLLTYPIRDIETVLGKFLACFLVFAVMIALTLVYPLFLSTLDTMGMGGDIEIGVLLCNYLGLLFMGGAFIAFGLLASSLTSNQIVAAVISFGAILIFWLIGFAAYYAGPVLEGIFKDLSLLTHFESFSKGTIQTHDVIYYVNFIVFCLFLTLRSLESNKWRG
jgi:ABC-2 type transport system permease protein